MFTKDELMQMPLKLLRLIDIYDQEAEKVLQEVILLKEQNSPLPQPIKMSDIPEIKTPEQEAGWQKVVDLRVEAAKPQVELPNQTESPTITSGIEIQPPLCPAVNLLACDKCEFVGKSERGLKVHYSTKHK